jgi:hypothetical protein
VRGEVLRARESSGLSVDPETVTRARANSRRADYPFPGLFFTPEEERELESVDDQLADRVEAVLMDADADMGEVRWGWRDGRRVVVVSVTREVERFEALVARDVDADRVIVAAALYSGRELHALGERISAEREELVALGIDPSSWGPEKDCVSLRYFAADREHARRTLSERYGPMLVSEWLGPSGLAEAPRPFGSWVADGSQLTVFYALAHDRPGTCRAEEHADRVLVALSVLAPQGAVNGAFLWRPSHATVQLRAPLDQRLVIDAAENVPRPRWTGESD